MFRPHIEKVETEFPNCTDVVYFDGASNVQLAGRILEASYPRIEVLHGAEHVISLFFGDIFKLNIFNVFDQIAKRCYKIFGSGSMHSPYGIFHKHTRNHNEGRDIGLIRAAGTRMAGNAIVLLRLLRLKPALISTITSPDFLQFKLQAALCKLLLSDKMWKDIEIIIKAVYPALLLLRLADKKTPAMDRLYYYSRKLEESLKNSKQYLDDLQANYDIQEGSCIEKKMIKYFLSSDKDGEKCFKEFKFKVLQNTCGKTNGKVSSKDNNEYNSDDSNNNDSDDESMVDTISDIESDDFDVDTSSRVPNSLGTDIIELYFEHDVAISGWMLSPKKEVMDDAKNHSSIHRDAVERLLKKWYGNKVSLFVIVILFI